MLRHRVSLLAAAVFVAAALLAPVAVRAEAPDDRTNDDYRSVVDASRADVARCAKSGAGGITIDVRFNVLEDGSVRNVVVTLPVRDDAVQRCVAGVVGALRFRAVRGDTVSLHVPYHVAARADAGATDARAD